MSAPPQVSVIIPTFNSANVIAETLATVAGQTHPEFEVIIAVDAGSTDATATVVQAWCDRDPRFRCVIHPHCGISQSRNIAVQHARGELLAFLDADDLWRPEKLARQLADFRDHPEINFSYTNYVTWDGRTEGGLRYGPNKKLPEGNVLHSLIHSCLFGTSTIMVRRELFHRAGGFDPEIPSCEDWDLWLRLAEHGLFAKGIRDPLVRYRRWEGNHSNVRMREAEHNLIVLTKNVALTQSPAAKKIYQQALKKFYQKRELTRAKLSLETAPESIPAVLWRAWRLNPREVKWLLRWGLVAWPRALGGAHTAALVHRTLREKF